MPFTNTAVRRTMSLEKSRSLAFSVRVEDRLHVNIIDEEADLCWFTVRPSPYVIGQDDDDLDAANTAATGAGLKAEGVFFKTTLTEDQQSTLTQAQQDALIRESQLFTFEIQAAALDLDPESEWFYDISYSKDGYSISIANGPLVISANPMNRAADELFGGVGDVYRLVSTIDGRNLINVTAALPMPQDGPAGVGTYYTTEDLAVTVGGSVTIDLEDFVVPSGRSLAANDLIYSTSTTGTLGIVTAVNWGNSPVDAVVTTLQRFGIDGLNALTYANVITGAAAGGDPSYTTAITAEQDWTVLKAKVPLPTGHAYHVGDLVVGFARQSAIAGAPAKVFIGLIKTITGTSLTVTTKYTVSLLDSDSISGLLASKANSTLQVNGVGIAGDAISLTLDNVPDATNYKRMTAAERTKLAALPDSATLAALLSARAAAVHSHVISDVTGLQTVLDTKVASDEIDTIKVMTLAAYTALATKDSRTHYLIVG